ncbi:MAG: LysR family transcriptional regulator [Elusimicrobia bacterium]|nr:LysR family transcriptional regulator [Elusimicrobiota bacterium]
MNARRFPFDPGLLEALLAAAQTGRVTAAARELNLTQPAVTARLRRLERAVGAPLLARSARGVTLTPAGRELCERARKIQALLEEGAAAVAGAPSPTGRLALAASTTIASYVLPPLLARFRAAYPRIALSLSVGNTEEVLERVRSGIAPLGLVEGHGRAPAVRLEPFLEDEIVAVRSPRSAVAVRGPADLARQTLLWRERGSGTRAVVERALGHAGGRRRGSAGDVELGGTEAIKSAAAAGLGVGFVSRWALQGDAAGRLAILLVPGLSIRRVFRWVLPAAALSGTAAVFRDFARAHPPALNTGV